MDITPIAGYLSTISLPMMIFLSLTFISGILVAIFGRPAGLPGTAFIAIGTLVAILSLGIAGTTVLIAKAEKMIAVDDYITSLGFERVEGKVSVLAGTDSEITVEKKGQQFKCTQYAPSDANDYIFFVCDSHIGYGKGNLEDLSKNVKDAPTSVPTSSPTTPSNEVLGLER